MAQVTKTPDQWRRNSGSWSSSNVSGQQIRIDSSNTGGYRINLAQAMSVTATSLAVSLVSDGLGTEGGAVIKCTARGLSGSSVVWSASQSYTWDNTKNVSHTFSFSGLTGNVNAIEYTIETTNGGWGYVTGPTASYTYTPPTLGLSVTPSSCYVGDTITGTIQEPFGQTFTVRFSYGSTTLDSFSTSSSSFSRTANASWFTTAGVTGTSMRVNVSVTDGLGRSASGQVTVNKHTALVPSITAPKGGSYNGANAITFAWTSSGDGKQTKAELQYSKDNLTWSSLTSFTDDDTSWYCPGGTFTAGTVYWRIRLTNNHGITSGWVSASFTVTAAVPVVTLTSPTSGSLDGAQAITFAWTIAKGSERITGTQISYSTDDGVSWSLLSGVPDEMTSYKSVAGKFPAGKLLWRVRARDSYAGWGAWKQATITITYAAAVVTLTAPTSGTKDGGQAIAFNWTVAKGSGNVTGTQMDYSTDSGVTWTSLVNSTAAVTSYSAAAGKFPAGSLIWRVRAKDQYAGWGAYKQATITVSYAVPTVTLTTPTSGSVDGAETITFAWTIAKGSGTVSGTQMDYSSDDGISWTSLVNSSGQVTTYTSSIAQFPAGKLLWRVRARDSFSQAGWGAWKQATITITYAAVSQVVPVNSPTSGIISALEARTFSVRLDASAPVYARFQISEASFFWRSGESGEYTELEMTPDGNTASVTIPSGTFPSGIIQWYATATDTTDRTTETDVYTLTALQAEVEATPIAPINVVESGSGPILFRWSFGSLDGSAQSRAELQYSLDGETWESLGSVQGTDTSFTAPGGTFPGGTVYWRVRSYNAAGTEGPWSDPATFVAYAAAIVTGVTGNGRPFATISWQSIGQEAYEIEVDGTRYGPYFGAEVREYTLKEPLTDGSHTVRVRAQNRLGLWSEWISAEMSVVNVPGSPFMIRAENSSVARIILMGGAILPPVITQQPRSIQAVNISQFSFRTYYNNPNRQVFHYTWERKRPGYDWENALASDDYLTGAGTTSIGISINANISGHNGWQYRAKMWNDVGTVYSDPAVFTYAEPAYTAPAVKGFSPADTGYFLIYRKKWLSSEPNKLIGKFFDADFVDRFSIGAYVYSVKQVLPGGYYTDSTFGVVGTSSVDCPMFAPLAGGDFLALKLSENADREVRVTEGREVEWTQYAGADYPSAEIGEARSKAVALDVSALMGDTEFRDAFTAMLGQDVIVKTPDGTVVIGPLESLDMRAPKPYRAWTFGVTQMEWEDFIDESQS